MQAGGRRRKDSLQQPGAEQTEGGERNSGAEGRECRHSQRLWSLRQGGRLAGLNRRAEGYPDEQTRGRWAQVAPRGPAPAHSGFKTHEAPVNSTSVRKHGSRSQQQGHVCQTLVGVLPTCRDLQPAPWSLDFMPGRADLPQQSPHAGSPWRCLCWLTQHPQAPNPMPCGSRTGGPGPRRFLLLRAARDADCATKWAAQRGRPEARSNREG